MPYRHLNDTRTSERNSIPNNHLCRPSNDGFRTTCDLDPAEDLQEFAGQNGVLQTR
jgi:hypothetical protein